MRLGLLLLLLSSLYAADTITALGHSWKVPYGNEWVGTPDSLRMLTARPQESNPRAPIQYALLEGKEFESFRLECEVKRDSNSLILVYNWQDATHFNYVHLSIDSPEKQPVHNGVFHVFGGDRVRISKTKGEGSLPTNEWTPVILDYNATTGHISVTVAGKKFPSLEAADLSLTKGKVGLGSFFETAQFRNFKVTAK